MKKLIAVLLCAMCVFSLAACAGKSPEPVEQTETEGSAELVGMQNPFVDYDTMEAACEAAGFDFAVPDTVDGYAAERQIQVMNGTMIQVMYLNENGDRVIIRKAPGSDDISGDYTIYATEKVITIGDDTEVKARGDEDLFSSAVWTTDNFTYAVMLDQPTDELALVSILNEVN